MNFHLSRYQRTGSGAVELVQFQTKVLHIPPNAKHGSWRKFDIQGTVYSWFSEVETNLGMVISSSTHPQLIADGTSQETMVSYCFKQGQSSHAILSHEYLLCHQMINSADVQFRSI